MLPSKKGNNLAAGANYFVEGFQTIFQPGLRIYILVPILINVVLFVILTTLLVNYFGETMDGVENALPSWLQFLTWIIWILFALVLVVVYGFSFNAITTLIAAPFYGKLAQKTEEMITGVKIPDEPLAQMVPRVFGRELSKLAYFIPRSIFFFILSFFFPPIIFVWGAWSMAVQYSDYGPDNNQLHFRHVRDLLGNTKYSSFGFGATTLGCSMIPVLNILAMPAAVVGGTIFWVSELKGKVEENY